MVVFLCTALLFVFACYYCLLSYSIIISVEEESKNKSSNIITRNNIYSHI